MFMMYATLSRTPPCTSGSDDENGCCGSDAAHAALGMDPDPDEELVAPESARAHDRIVDASGAPAELLRRARAGAWAFPSSVPSR